MDDAELVRPMKAYWYDFEPTGVDCIDKVLSAVACAGKAYHHTEYWYEPARPYGGHSGGTPVEWIQNAAREASDRIEAMIAERDRQYDENVHRIAEQARVEAERDAARDAALEEAAKMVDVFFGQNAFADADLYKWGTLSGAQAIAAAIRAMKGKSHE